MAPGIYALLSYKLYLCSGKILVIILETEGLKAVKTAEKRKFLTVLLNILINTDEIATCS